MIETDDWHLLHDYVANGSQASFAKLAARHVNLVYSAAMRQMRNRHDAEDVTQAVFLILAQKARRIRSGVVLGAWLLKVTRFAAMDLIKKEGRRKRHEKNAGVELTATRITPMANSTRQSAAEIGPVDAALDEVMSKLSASARNALVVRFFERRSYKQVGERLGITEEAAKQRVFRGVERLRNLLARRGANTSAEGLSTMLGAMAVRSAPPGMSTIAVDAVAKGAAAGPAAIAKGAVALMLWAKAKMALAALPALLLIGGGVMLVHHWAIAPNDDVVVVPPAIPIAQPVGYAPVNAANRSLVPQPKFWGGRPKKPVPQPPITGLLRNPDQTPAVGYEVLVATASTPVSMFLSAAPTMVKAVSDTDGRFSIQPMDIPTALIVRGAAGYAIAPMKRPLTAEIVLKPWARLEGIARSGSQPVANGWIQLIRNDTTADELNVICETAVATDEMGRFVFDRMLPGEWLASPRTPKSRAVQYQRLVVAESGTTTTLLGGSGRTVVGQIAGADEPNIAIEIMLYSAAAPTSPTTSPALPIKPTAQYKFWANADRSFRINDVEPGRYKLVVRSTFGDPRRPHLETVATGQKEIQVSMDGPSDQPINTGTLLLQKSPALSVGQTMPPLEASAADGAAVHLEDFRGKYVLLHLWTHERHDSVENLGNLAAAYDRFGDDPRLVILSIQIRNPSAKQPSPWLPEWRQATVSPVNMPREYLASPSLLFMIAPDGKLMARNFDAVQAFGLLDTLLNKERQ